MNHTHFRWCLLLLVAGTPGLKAQSVREIPYFDATADKLKKEAAEHTNASVQSTFVIPEHFNKEAKKAYTDERLRISQNIAATIQETALFDDVLFPFLKQVHANIVSANPGLPATNVLLTREPVPNAFSVGEGTLVVYTGLLSELENEDQLAFVLCHELAHYTLHHATKQLVQEIERFQSKEFKAQIKKVQEAEFNQSEMFESMFRNVQFKSRYHRRDLERQADSLAYRYFLKTAYDPAQARRLMQLFETIDQPMQDTVLHLDQSLGCAQHPFQQKWLDNGGGSIWSSAVEAQKEMNKSLSDSLSTHPDAELRQRWITDMARELGAPERQATAGNFRQVRFVSALENVEAWYQSARYDKVIYMSLLYQNVYPECVYFKDIMALAINGLFVYSKNHRLSEVLSQTSPYYEARYNQLLTVLNNLRLSDMTALQSCLMTGQNKSDSEYALFAAYCFASAQEDAAQAKIWRKKYLQWYPKGRFADVIAVEK